MSQTRNARAAVIAAGVLAAAAVAMPAEAQTLRIASSDFSPARGVPVSVSRQSLYAFEAYMDPLTTVDGKGVANPKLALSWAVQDDKKVWRFKLRPGVTFHNGRPWNADAGVAAVEYLLSDEGKRLMASVGANTRSVAGARKVDDLTLEILTHAPDPILPNSISVLYVMEMKAFAEMGGAGPFGMKPVGTGPLQVLNWDDQQIETKRHDRSWRKVAYDGITFLNLPEMPARSQALISGQVDIALTINKEMRQAVERSGSKMYAEYAPSVNALIINHPKHPAFKDKRVRQAFNHALDKRIVQELYGEDAKAGSQPAAHSVRGFQPDIKPYAFDVAKAKALMTEAGFANGFTINGEVQSGSGTVEIYEFAAQSLQKIGVTLSLNVITTADIIAKINGSRPWEGVVFGMNFGSAPIGDVMRPVNSFHSCAQPQKWICYEDMEPLRNLINTEFDEKKRDAGLRELALRYHDDPPVIYLDETVVYHGHSNKISGFRSENFLISYDDIKIAK